MNVETAEVELRGEVFKPNVVLSIGEKRTVKGAAKDPYVQKRCVREKRDICQSGK